MIALIIPSNRPASLEAWLEAWGPELAENDVRLYIVRDNPETYKQIDDRLGRDSWIIPRHSDCIRSWGFLNAYWDGATHFLTMDDDCYPHTPSFVRSHVAWLDHPAAWLSTISGLVPRGMPKEITGPRVMINHGLWSNVPDLDGATQLVTPKPYIYSRPEQWIPAGMFFPMSGMNLSFRREIMSAMWFGLMGDKPDGTSWTYHRYGDIFAGLFAKRVCDHLGYAIHSGSPVVRHDRASDPVKNAAQEVKAKEALEWLWWKVATTQLNTIIPSVAYRQIADTFGVEGSYWIKVAEGMYRWVDLLERGV